MLMKIGLPLALLGLLTACGPKFIPGTTVEDSRVNRTIVDVLTAYKQAVERRDVDTLVSLCSSSYYEDNGNADPKDDYGFSDLQKRVLPEAFKRLNEVRVDLEIRDVQVLDDRAQADVRFTYKAKMALPSGEKWHTDTEVNRLEFAKEGESWKIVSGL